MVSINYTMYKIHITFMLIWENTLYMDNNLKYILLLSSKFLEIYLLKLFITIINLFII